MPDASAAREIQRGDPTNVTATCELLNLSSCRSERCSPIISNKSRIGKQTAIRPEVATEKLDTDDNAEDGEALVWDPKWSRNQRGKCARAPSYLDKIYGFRTPSVIIAAI